MNEHHFNFLDQEDIKKQFEKIYPRKLPNAIQVPMKKDLETKKKEFIAEHCPEWAKPENSGVIWEYDKKESLGEASKRLGINLTNKPMAHYKASLLDNWLFYENGYIARYNEGSSEIRKAK